MKGLSGSEVTAELKKLAVNGRFEFLLTVALKNIKEMAVSVRSVNSFYGFCIMDKDIVLRK